MAILKAPENKAMGPRENKMPSGAQEQRNKVCEDAGHRFSLAIMHMLEDREKNAGRIPDFALCIRCGNRVNLKEEVV